jgi:hypothetical protein
MSEPHNFLRYILTGKPDADPAIGPRVRLQQYLDLSRAAQLMVLVTVCNAAIAGYLAYSVTQEMIVIAWVSTNLIVAVLIASSHVRASGRPPPEDISSAYVRRSETLSILAGVVFASLPLYLQKDPFEPLIVSAFFSVSMCAGLMCALPRNPRLVIRYLTGAITPLLVHVALHANDRMVAIAIALTLLALMIYFGCRASFRLYLNDVRLVEDASQLRNILEVALDRSGQAFAVRSKDGRIIFENPLHKQVQPALRNREAVSGVVHVLERYWQTARYEVDSVGSVEIFTDVTRIEDARQEAEALREEAYEASHAKTRFLQSVTPELLVPLRTIRLQASMMDTGSRIPVSREDVSRAAEQIRLLTESLESRVEQIIRYASAETAQSDHAADMDLSESSSSPVLKLVSLLRRSLRDGLTR